MHILFKRGFEWEEVDVFEHYDATPYDLVQGHNPTHGILTLS